MKYTLVAYREEADDYCRGCKMASSSSHFEMYINLSREDLVDKWAAILFEEEKYPHWYGSHEINITTEFKGLTVSLGGYIESTEYLPDDDYYEFDSQNDILEIEMEAKSKAESLFKEYQDEQARRANSERAKEQASKKEQELAELARLQAKYTQ